MGDTFTAVFRNPELGAGNVKRIIDNLNNSIELNEKLWDISTKGVVAPGGLIWDVHTNDEIRLAGLDRYRLFVGPYLIQLESEISWKGFVTLASVRQQCREVCYEFSKLFGLPMYLPDSYDSLSYVFEGKDYEFLSNKLEREGREEGQIFQISDSDRISSSAVYYIDHFRDFP